MKIIIIFSILIFSIISATISYTNTCCSSCLQNSLNLTSSSIQKCKNILINSIKSNYSASKTVSVINNCPIPVLLSMRQYFQKVLLKKNMGINICGGLSKDAKIYSSLDPLDIPLLFSAVSSLIQNIDEGYTDQYKTSLLKQIQQFKTSYLNNYDASIDSVSYLPWNSSPNNLALIQINTILNGLSYFSNQLFPAFINQSVSLYDINPSKNIKINGIFTVSIDFEQEVNSLKFLSNSYPQIYPIDFLNTGLKAYYNSSTSQKKSLFGQNWTKIQNLINSTFVQPDLNATIVVPNADGSTNITIKLPFLPFQKRDASQLSIFDPVYLDLLLKTPVTVPDTFDSSTAGNNLYLLQARLATNIFGMLPVCFYKDKSFFDAFQSTCPGSCKITC